MNDQEEAAYILGRKAFARELLGRSIGELGGTGLTMEQVLAERAEAIATLRGICEEYGDNDWEDDLHLSDIISKHLGNYLES
jgi:hypothetical protein